MPPERKQRNTMTILQKSLELRKRIRWVRLLVNTFEFIHAEIRTANKQIEAMHTIVNDYENKEHKAILNEHFGEHHDIKAIQKHVDMLRTGKVGIKVVRSNQPFEAWTKKQTGKVAFGLSFHSEDKTTQRRAGVLLHEATHALWDTKDRYKRVGEGENAHLQGIERVEYTNLEKDEGQREHLVKGCKFCILLDTISR